MKKLTDYSLAIQIMLIPLAWIIMIAKILLVIPVFVIARCNYVMSKIE
jgi:hypothetical protein